MSQRCAIIIFAKAPMAGLAKTRLIPALGADGAAALAERMLDWTLAAATAADIGPVILCCTPTTGHPAFASAVEQYGVILGEQGEGDLGARMNRALTLALQNHSAALVIGTDCPTLDADHLRRAASMLRTTPAVFIPATDGGYVLAGLSVPMPTLFEAIAWSTDRVMAQTRERLTSIKVVAAELSPMQDIDVPADLMHLPREWLK
ncbi:MAG: TIGR04282 family arsenosugar biosynthesis glycosyltransferase [Pseudomonadota bacterium]